MSFTVAILLFVVGVALGVGFAMMAARWKTSALAERSSALENEGSALRTELAALRARHDQVVESKVALEATLASERRNAEEKLQLLRQAQDEMRAQFESLAARALQNNNANFLDLAKATLERQQSEAKGELEKREQAVKTLVEPIAQSLKQVEEQVRALEEKRAHAYGTLSTQVESMLKTQQALQTETGNLVKALREPQARGRWGEVQLRRVIEMAGMLEYCDFDEQVTVIGDDRRIRPDVVVKLPGDKQIVVDAKAPILAYLASLEAPDEATRSLLLADHARQVRAHIDGLASKRYWQQFAATPEFVILFLPGEVFFRAAWDAYPELIEESVSRGVVVASPVTLIALLKAVAYGWNQRNVEESAHKLIEASTTLYERLCTMTRHFESLGSRLGRRTGCL